MQEEAKKAVAKAKAYLEDLMSVPAGDIQLEEIEISGDGLGWLLTLSYPSTGALSRYGRNFKRVRVNRTTGEVDAVQIRVLNE
jgi:hypothetical protein